MLLAWGIDVLMWAVPLSWGPVPPPPPPPPSPFRESVVRPGDIQQFLNERFTPPRKRGKRLSLQELLLISQRDDMFRRRREGN